MNFVSILISTICLIFPTHGAGTLTEYVTQMTNSGNVKQAAIISLLDGGVWASSPGFSLKDGEGKNLVTLFKTPQNVIASGLTVAGVKYLGLQGDHRSIYGKTGDEGVVCFKAKKSIVIGTYTVGMQLGNAASTVGKFADYLINNGY